MQGLLLFLLVPMALIGFHFIWGILGEPWVVRSPFRIVIVGLLICALGLFFQEQLHHAEGVPEWLGKKYPIFYVNRDFLDVFKKFVDVVVYAAGGGVIASALFTRAQLCFQQEQREQVKIKHDILKEINELKWDLRFLEADALINRVGNVQERREAILRILGRCEEKLERANRILKVMGE
ncbi:hypothetical protein [Burkholderia cenocepacia]|uniref:hypothetical protein n=1 Tax=Burkholderia cenocepacia TaxID=95486 RepID=UPI002AB5F0B4|nr:hypothetical protein [Burkholderia cenocepacia]